MSTAKKCVLVAIGIIIVAVLGSVFTSLGQQWYSTLQRPSEWPPAFLFAVVWTVVYIITFFTLCNTVKEQNSDVKKLIVLAIVNGVLNILWCLVFFTLQQLFLGVVIIVLNLAAAILLICEVKKQSKPLWYYLMLIYPIWVGIATTLNTAVWILN